MSQIRFIDSYRNRTLSEAHRLHFLEKKLRGFLYPSLIGNVCLVIERSSSWKALGCLKMFAVEIFESIVPLWSFRGNCPWKRKLEMCEKSRNDNKITDVWEYFSREFQPTAFCARQAFFISAVLSWDLKRGSDRMTRPRGSQLRAATRSFSDIGSSFSIKRTVNLSPTSLHGWHMNFRAGKFFPSFTVYYFNLLSSRV